MDIGEAVHQLKQGFRVQRSGWNGKGMFLFLNDNNPPATSEYYVGDTTITAEEQPWVAMYTAQGTVVPWLCSQTDLLAEDWGIA